MGSFPHCYHRIPDRTNLNRGGLVWAPTWRVWFITVAEMGCSWAQCMCNQELQRGERQDDSACSILMQPESSAWNGAAHSLDNSSHLNYPDLEAPSKRCQKICLLGGCGDLNENDFHRPYLNTWPHLVRIRRNLGFIGGSMPLGVSFEASKGHIIPS